MSPEFLENLAIAAAIVLVAGVLRWAMGRGNGGDGGGGGFWDGDGGGDGGD